MRILYAVPDPGITPRARGGGFQTHVRETIENLVLLGHRVSLLDSGKVELAATGRPRGGASHGWKETLPQAIRFVGRDTLYLLHNRRFRRSLGAFVAGHGPFDVVYERYHAFEWATGAWARRRGLPWVLEFNASVDELKLLGGLGLGTIGRNIEREVVRRAHHVVAVSGVLRGQLLGMGVESSRAHTLHNGVDVEAFRPSIRGDEVRDRWNLGGRVVIGFVGSFAAYHGVDLFLEAARRVSTERPDVAFFLVGGRQGNARYQGLRARYEGSIRPGSLVFAGDVPHVEIPAHIAAMDVAVIPMAADYGSPTKTFEYMAMGRAVLAPAVPALLEVLQDGRTAMLSHPGSVDDLARGMLALAGDPELRARLGLGAREAVLQRHTWSGNARFIEGLLQRALEEGPR